MAPGTTQHVAINTQRPSPIAIVGEVFRWLLACFYLSAGIWIALTKRWQTADALWVDGAWGLPGAALQSLALVLVLGWLIYGLAWPVRAGRPWLWVGLGVLQLVLLVLLGLGWLALCVSALHLLAFDPRWLPRRVPAEPEALFYDGHCGLCHRWVKRVVRADADGSLFYFAPLQGRTFEQVLTPSQRASLPDSIVVRAIDGRVLVRSDAVLHILAALGGWYRLVGLLAHAIPRPMRDLAYDCVARVRHRLFAKPAEACPMVSSDLRERFRF